MSITLHLEKMTTNKLTEQTLFLHQCLLYVLKILKFKKFQKDFLLVKHSIYQLVLFGGFLRIGILQNVETFGILFLYVVIIDICYFDGILRSFSVDWVPNVNKIYINIIFCMKDNSYGISFLRYYYVFDENDLEKMFLAWVSKSVLVF